MSIARPKACCDQVSVPSTYRQLKPDVLFAFMERASSAPKRSTSFIRLNEYRCLNRRLRTPRTGLACFEATIRSPLRTWPPNPQCVIERRRRSFTSVGQPCLQDRGTSLSSTRLTLPTKRGPSSSSNEDAPCAFTRRIARQRKARVVLRRVVTALDLYALGAVCAGPEGHFSRSCAGRDSNPQPPDP